MVVGWPEEFISNKTIFEEFSIEKGQLFWWDNFDNQGRFLKFPELAEFKTIPRFEIRLRFRFIPLCYMGDTRRFSHLVGAEASEAGESQLPVDLGGAAGVCRAALQALHSPSGGEDPAGTVCPRRTAE